MKYAPYPNYKRSPIFWLDETPQHWNTAALRWLSRRYAGGTPDKGNDAYWEDGDIPWLNSGAVNDGYITEPSALISREGFANSSAKWIPKDALVMALAGQGKTKGMVAQLGIKTTCNQSMAAIIPDHRLVPRYLYWWLSANYQNIRNMAGGEARDGLNLEMLGSIQCPLPSPGEQQTIACFLDAKTAQIDTLVAKKRQLIGKLREKRSALIARTVTHGLPPEVAKAKGLEPNSKVKDSEVPWLPKLPAHWTIKRLKRISDRVTVGVVVNPSSYVTDDGVPFLLGGDVREFRIDIDSCNRCSEEASKVELRKSRLVGGDLVVVRVGYPGVAAVVPKEIEGANCASMMIVGRHDRFDSQWLAYAINSKTGRDQVELVQYGAAQKQFNISHAVDFVFPYPPLDEQRAIACYLDFELARLDRLNSVAESVIIRLVEYRQALITAAVTGKIDVGRFRNDQ